eukprot:551463_1
MASTPLLDHKDKQQTMEQINNNRESHISNPTDDKQEDEKYDEIDDNDFKQFLQTYQLSPILYQIFKLQELEYDDLKTLTTAEIDQMCSGTKITIGAKRKFQKAVKMLKNEHSLVGDKNEFKFDHEMTVILIGNKGVGKTCLMWRYSKNIFREQMLMTHGIGESVVKRLTLGNKKVMRVVIWDTAGQEKYQSICKQYYHKADVILYCYDMTDKKSLNNSEKWRKQIEENVKKDNVIVQLVGCKSEAKKIKKPNVEKIVFATEWKKYKIEDIECSAKSGANVSNVFQTVAEMMIQERKSDRVDEKIEEKKLINFKKPPKCNVCNGSSFVQCEKCNGFYCVKCDSLSDGSCKKCQKGWGCFSSDSFVITYPNYEKKQINKLQIYDKILTYDESKNKYFWDDLLIKCYFEKNEFLQNELIPMIEFTLNNNEKMTMTANHLLYVNNDGLKTADTVEIGDRVKHFKDDTVQIISIKENVMKYPRSLMTYNGNLVINGIAMSTFTNSLKGESVYFGKSLRYIMNNYYDYKVFRYPVYYITKWWTEYASFDIKQAIVRFHFHQ